MNYEWYLEISKHVNKLYMQLVQTSARNIDVYEH